MYERLLITFAIMVFFAGTLFVMKRRQIAAANRAAPQLGQASKRPTIVYFWSPGCPVCKLAQRQVLDRIIAEYGEERLTLTAYNIDKAPDIAKEWSVMTLPTTFLFDSSGRIRHVNNGLAAAETLRNQLKPIMERGR